MAKRLAGRYGYPKDEPFKVTLHPDKLREPSHWRNPQKIFVCSMSDLFHNDITDDQIFDVLNEGLMGNRRHTYMILTKRPERMAQWFANNAHRFWHYHTSYEGRRQYVVADWPDPQLWLGVTAENQRTADERIPILLQIPAAKHFVSVEPMLEFMNLSDYLWEHDNRDGLFERDGLDWVIAGPETGARARPMQTHWVSVLANDCRAAGVPFFDKKDVLGEGIQEWPR
jgi:protein gp37